MANSQVDRIRRRAGPAEIIPKSSSGQQSTKCAEEKCVSLSSSASQDPSLRVGWRRCFCVWLQAPGEKNVAPCPSTASAQMCPPCRWTIRCAFAKPEPNPSNSSPPCSRWNGPNNLCTYFISNPTPLSPMNTAYWPSTTTSPTLIVAVSRKLLNFRALETRLVKSSVIKSTSHLASGNFPIRHSTRRSPISERALSMTRITT
jgi:hypothetical protein